MPTDDHYIPFLALPREWAAEAGMPEAMVLRNLCDWAMADAFPVGAFVTATGEKVDPLDIFMSARALVSGLSGITLDGVTHYSQRWGLAFLSEVLLTVRDLRFFCKNINTQLPPSLRRGFRRLWVGRSTDKHLAPPPCPQAEERASKRHARDAAIGTMNYLRAILAGLQGRPGPRRIGQPIRIGNEPIDFDDWGAKWAEARDGARGATARCEDDGLRQELDELDVEWAAFVTAESSAATRAPKSEVGETQGTMTEAREIGTQTAEPPISKRTAGQFSKARLEEWFDRWVAQNVACGTIPSRDEDWNAAKAALGDGVPRDDVRELRRTRSPENWQRKGRRKSA